MSMSKYEARLKCLDIAIALRTDKEEIGDILANGDKIYKWINVVDKNNKKKSHNNNYNYYDNNGNHNTNQGNFTESRGRQYYGWQKILKMLHLFYNFIKNYKYFYRLPHVGSIK